MEMTNNDYSNRTVSETENAAFLRFAKDKDCSPL